MPKGIKIIFDGYGYNEKTDSHSETEIDQELLKDLFFKLTTKILSYQNNFIV